MKIGILTSSRADYGIYLPLLNSLKNEKLFNLEIIAFGTHLSKKNGYTLNDIIRDNYKCVHKISSLIDDDSEKGIVRTYGNTVIEFSDFWQKNKYDLVFCLGDRYEMSAAVQASIPFQVKLAHIHGGEVTLGSIDNVFRHQITLASKFHFVTTDNHRAKVKKLIDSQKFVYNVGSLSLSDFNSFKPINKTIFFKNLNLKEKPYILVTFHPETVSVSSNKKYAKVMKSVLKYLSSIINIIITMPNADTLGSVFRKEINDLKKEHPKNILVIENFGKIKYFNAMYYSSLLIGNTSSGIIEAASFNKYVINVGDRQKGRSHGANVFNVEFDSRKIIELTHKLLTKKNKPIDNIYYKINSSKSIIEILKKNYK